MTTRILIVHDELTATRLVQFRENNPAAVGHELPWNDLYPGEVGAANVTGNSQIEIREGEAVPADHVPMVPDYAPSAAAQGPNGESVLEVADGDFVIINGSRFPGLAFRWMADPENVGRQFTLFSNEGGDVHFSYELAPQEPDTLGQMSIGGVVTLPPPEGYPSGLGDTLPGEAMLSEVPDAPDLTIHADQEVGETA